MERISRVNGIYHLPRCHLDFCVPMYCFVLTRGWNPLAIQNGTCLVSFDESVLPKKDPSYCFLNQAALICLVQRKRTRQSYTTAFVTSHLERGREVPHSMLLTYTCRAAMRGGVSQLPHPRHSCFFHTTCRVASHTLLTQAVWCRSGR